MPTLSDTDVFPKLPQSYWLHSAHIPSFSPLQENIHVDVAVVGAGITGITTAYLLARQGVKTAVVDAGRIGWGTTGHTTAKLTAQHGLIYEELIAHFGEEKARQYYEANREGIRLIKGIIAEEGIECRLTAEDAYVYGQTNEEVEQIIAENEAYAKLGIPGEYAEATPLPFKTRAAIVMKGQSHFDPIPYLAALSDRIVKRDGQIYENTAIIGMDKGASTVLHTSAGHTVSCQYAVSASHFPFHDLDGLYFARLHAERSYAMLVRTEKPYPSGMYLSAGQPKRSLRPVAVGGESYVIVGGDSHKTGQGICTFSHYEALKQFAQEHFGLKEIVYRWSAQDLYTLDKVPYIGPQSSRSPQLLIATGFRKWGMSSSAAAARLICDLITGGDNPYRELFSPSRLHVDPDVKTFVTQNANVAKHLIAGKLGLVHRRVEELKNDEGAAVRINGKRAGAYRDEEGKLHQVDTTCTHLGCETEWNEAERSWDCPCHGSRFSYDGHVLEGPAKEPLARI